MATKKRAGTQKTSAKRTVVKKKVVPTAKNQFWNVEFNINTVYWIIIGIAVISTAAWTYNTNQQISDIYDSVDQTNSVSDAPIIPNRHTN